VVPRGSPTLQRYYLSKTTGEQFALSGLVFEALLVVGLLGVLSAMMLPFVSLIRRWRWRGTQTGGQLTA
jgi:hypothetical protein